MSSSITVAEVDFSPYLQAEAPDAPPRSPDIVPRVVRAGHGELWRLPHETRQQLLAGRHTGGAFSLTLSSVAPGHGQTPHIHEREDVMYLVQQGTFDFRLDGKTFQIGPGDFVFAPRETAHGYTCTSAEGGTLFVWLMGAGLEQFWREMAEATERSEPLSEADLWAKARDYGVRCAGDTPVAQRERSEPQYVRGVATAPPTLIRDGVTPLMEAFGNRGALWIDSRTVGGRFAIGPVETPSQGGPPLHIHEREDETLLILAGQYNFTIGNESYEVSAGDVVFAPRGVPHTFRVASTEPGRAVTLLTPGGLDSFWREAVQLFARGDTSPTALSALAGEYGIRFVEAEV